MLMTTRPATIETVQLVVSRGLVSWLGRGSVRLVIVFRGGDKSWLSGKDTSHGAPGRIPVMVVRVAVQPLHCGQGRTPAIVVRGREEPWWSEEKTSHGGHRRPVMVVRGGDK